MKGILFLCVANSARSQMAEGICRSMAPRGVSVWSAGSRPTSVRPEAVAVMNEIGIDISTHRSKSTADIPVDQVDVVVTLCAEQECPFFPGHVTRLNWAMPDPAAPAESPVAVLEAFRRTRDLLAARIAGLFKDGLPAEGSEPALWLTEPAGSEGQET